jgi:hypothetical protein
MVPGHDRWWAGRRGREADAEEFAKADSDTGNVIPRAKSHRGKIQFHIA